MNGAEFLTLSDGSSLAYRHVSGREPGILFCSGFNSNMQGTKALALEQWCRDQGRQFTRFDYFGHGDSSGVLEQGCIGRWRDDGLAILDSVTTGPQLVVGSSMGGWIMLLLAIARPQRVYALVGLAAAPDFTRRLEASLTGEQRHQLADNGYADLPNCYDDGEPYRIGRHLIEEGAVHLLLGAQIPIDLKVRLIQGQRDEDVPWELALSLAEKLRSTDVEVQLVKEGDHRLSEPEDLRRLLVTVEQLLAP
jgi:pimeloyl-ACP methyl ester carboxylesterase